MTSLNLKVGPLPDRTPVKLSISVDPDLSADLAAYADIHSRAYGKNVSASELAPSMLRALIDSDAGFKRARRELNTKP